MTKNAISCLTLFCLFFSIGLSAQPVQFDSRGIGGGGAMFQPVISPFNTQHWYAVCDMTELFHTTDGGQSWDFADFRDFTTINYCKVQFTADPDVRYGLRIQFREGIVLPVRSDDGGASWQDLNNPQPDGLLDLSADPASTGRLLVTDWSRLYFSDDGGQSFEVRYDDNFGNLYVAGAFWDGDDIFVGTVYGLLVSHDGGQSFALENAPGLPAGSGFASFAGAKQGDERRFFAVVAAAGDLYPTVPANDLLWSYDNVYRLDYDQPGAAWEAVAGGVPANHRLVKTAMALDNTEIAYVAGTDENNSFPVVYKTVNGGGTWSPVFLTANNQNIATGWCGFQGDENWWYAEIPFGLAVAPHDPDVALISDYGFLHATADGGDSWRQAYLHPDDDHPAGAATPKNQSYRGNGLENTASWWLAWADADNLLAAYTDIGGIRSEDAGVSWSFKNLDRDDNSTFQFFKHPATGLLYAATSTVHDLYQSTYLQDSRIDNGDGRILVSSDGGDFWALLHDFGHPVVWMAADPNDPQILYASVVHSQQGGIYKTVNLGAGAASVWTKLPDPPRTEGHPLSLHVLPDGAVACSFSGRRNANGAFTNSSGVFLSTDGGQTWADRSHPDMLYWTKDLTVDQHDPTGSTWYAAVFSGWGGAANDKGGLFRTTDRGQNWTEILDLFRVESCAVHPADPNILYVTTEDEGLWFTADGADFEQLETYHFQHPMRVFFNPYDADEVWVTSFGNGLQIGATGSTTAFAPTSGWSVVLNPTIVSEKLALTLELPEAAALQITAFDTQGKAVALPGAGGQYAAGQHKLSWEVGEWSTGVYLLRILSGTGEQVCLRFLRH